MLLLFYTKVTQLLVQSSRLDRFRETFKSDIPRMISDFGSTTRRIQDLSIAELAASNMEGKKAFRDKEADEFCKHSAEIARHTALKCSTPQRQLTIDTVQKKLSPYVRKRPVYRDITMSPEACFWVMCTPEFEAWFDSPWGGLITMFGDMGCGKTTIATCIAQYMETESLSHVDEPFAIAEFYCKAQDPMPLHDIFKGIIYQIACSSTRPFLKSSFKMWHDDVDGRSHWDDQFLQDTEWLQQTLKTILCEPRKSTILILDGLDEMDGKDRKNLLWLLRSSIELNAQVKVFIASRPLDDIRDVFEDMDVDPPDGSFLKPCCAIGHIEMKPDIERDRILAEHFFLTVKGMPSKTMRNIAVEQIATRAKGSAIWMQMATTAMGYGEVVDEDSLNLFFEWLKTDPSLVALYSRVFQSGIPEQRREVAEKALEALAVARRPLNISEIFCAVYLSRPQAKDLEGLDKFSGFQDLLLNLLRPFLSINQATQRCSLVHQSLLELVLSSPPTQWQSLANKPTTHDTRLDTEIEILERRRESLHAAMLSRCIKYIMFDDFETKDLGGQLSEPAANDATLEMLQQFQPFDEPGPRSSHGSDNSSEAQSDLQTHFNPSGFDPEELGFGKFFAYAAAYWPDHFAQIPSDRQDLQLEVSTIVQLCGYRTNRLKSWAEVWKKPSCRFFDERPRVNIESLDPLAVMAYTNPTAATLGSLAQEKTKSPKLFSAHSEWTMVKILTEEWASCPDVIHRIIKDPAIGYAFCEPTIFNRLLGCLGTKGPQDPVDWPGPEWKDIFRSLIEELGPKLKPEVHTTLRKACHHGCLVLVQLLFEAGRQWPELGTEMLSAKLPDGDKNNDFVHQSVGEAVYLGHVDIVRYLCQQKGIEPHLKYVSPNGYNIFHFCERAPRSQILETLIPLWPQGVHTADKDGHLPMYWLLKGNAFHTEDGADTVALQTMLRLGKFNPKVLDGEPMQLATSKASVVVCRMLVEFGADPRRVIEVDQDGVPKLRVDRRPTVGPDQNPQQVMGHVLQCFCDLMKLPVSQEYVAKQPVQARK